MSAGLVLPVGRQQRAEWAKIDIEVLGVEPEMLAQLDHLLFQQHQCGADAFDSLIIAVPGTASSSLGYWPSGTGCS